MSPPRLLALVVARHKAECLIWHHLQRRTVEQPWFDFHAAAPGYFRDAFRIDGLRPQGGAKQLGHPRCRPAYVACMNWDF